MYVENKWYLLEAKDGIYDENDPIDSLRCCNTSKQCLNTYLRN